MISTKTLFYISNSYMLLVKNKIIPQSKFVKKVLFCVAFNGNSKLEFLILRITLDWLDFCQVTDSDIQKWEMKVRNAPWKCIGRHRQIVDIAKWLYNDNMVNAAIFYSIHYLSWILDKLGLRWKKKKSSRIIFGLYQLDDKYFMTNTFPKNR